MNPLYTGDKEMDPELQDSWVDFATRSRRDSEGDAWRSGHRQLSVSDQVVYEILFFCSKISENTPFRQKTLSGSFSVAISPILIILDVLESSRSLLFSFNIFGMR